MHPSVLDQKPGLFGHGVDVVNRITDKFVILIQKFHGRRSGVVGHYQDAFGRQSGGSGRSGQTEQA